MFWLLLVAAVAVVAVYTSWKSRGMRKAHRDMPIGIPRYPIIGHGYIFRGTDEDRMTSLQRVGRAALQRDGHTSVWMGHKLYAVIADAESIHLVAKICLEKDDTTMKYMRLVVGNGIVFAPAKIWRPRRKIMAPTFNMKNLHQFVATFDKQSTIMADLLRARAGRGDFSIWKYISTYTLDAVCESTLGIEIKSQKQPDHPFLVACDLLLQILARRMLSPWLYWDWVFKLMPVYRQFEEQERIVHDFLDELIRDKRRQLAGLAADKCSSECSQNTFLDMLIESSGGPKGYSDIELREEVMTLVVAGSDTSAVGIAFTALMLSRYPDVQEKAYKELREVFGDSDRAVTWKDLPNLKYLELVIKETLRLYPPVPIGVRDVHENVVLPSGSTLVPGMALVLHYWAMHRNAGYWGDDAEHFRPERFLDGPLRHPAQFIPFSYSLRNCLGYNYAMMSMKTTLANLLRRFALLPPAGLPAARLRDPLRVKFDVLLKHVDNFELRLEKRAQFNCL